MKRLPDTGLKYLLKVQQRREKLESYTFKVYLFIYTMVELHIQVADDMKELYQEVGSSSNAGYDLYFSSDTTVQPKQKSTLKFGLRCEAINIDGENVSYLLMPRSSIVKTTLFMANSIGLIDSSYRGDIMAVVFNYGDTAIELKRGERLFQLVPLNNGKSFDHVYLTDTLSETSRGSGGFGSTGK